MVFLRFERYTLCVRSTDPADLAWLTAFLECGFEPVAGPSCDAEITLEVDPEAYARTLAEGPAGGALVEGFAKDARPAMFERWRPEGTYRKAGHAVFYRVAHDGRSVTLLVPDRSDPCRLALMRVVRELAMHQVVSTGGVLMHAAAFGCDGDVIVVAGPKGHGKTTLLLSFLTATGARYVCNDRCVVRPSDRGATVRGIPTVLSIRSEGLDRFPTLRRHWPSELAETRPKGRILLAPQQLRALLGYETMAAGPVAAFLFPCITGGSRSVALRPLTGTEALPLFRAGLFRAEQPTVLGEVFVPPGTPQAGAWQLAADSARDLVTRVPCFACELGGDSAPTAEDCAAILAAVRGPGSG